MSRLALALLPKIAPPVEPTPESMQDDDLVPERTGRFDGVTPLTARSADSRSAATYGDAGVDVGVKRRFSARLDPNSWSYIRSAGLMMLG